MEVPDNDECGVRGMCAHVLPVHLQNDVSKSASEPRNRSVMERLDWPMGEVTAPGLYGADCTGRIGETGLDLPLITDCIA